MTRVGFIGTGRMGSALVQGFIKKALMKSEDVRVFDKDINASRALNLQTEYSAFEVVEKSDVVFLCVKPKDMDELLEKIAGITGSRLVVSVVAGVSTKKIESKLKAARVIRVMPNTPALIHESACAYCLGARAEEEDAVYVGSLMNSIGIAYRVSENQMDAVTGLSGSGPAYVYHMIGSLVAAGEKVGLEHDMALNLVLQTVRGATNMVIVTKKSTDELIDDVKSPKGTTAEGLKVLDDAKVGKAYADAVKAAAKRSKELGK